MKVIFKHFSAQIVSRKLLTFYTDHP